MTQSKKYEKFADMPVTEAVSMDRNANLSNSAVIGTNPTPIKESPMPEGIAHHQLPVILGRKHSQSANTSAAASKSSVQSNFGQARAIFDFEPR